MTGIKQINVISWVGELKKGFVGLVCRNRVPNDITDKSLCGTAKLGSGTCQ